MRRTCFFFANKILRERRVCKIVLGMFFLCRRRRRRRQGAKGHDTNALYTRVL